MKNTIALILSLLVAAPVMADEVPYLHCGSYQFNLLEDVETIRAQMCHEITGLDGFLDEQTDRVSELEFKLMVKSERLKAAKKEIARLKRRRGN